MIWFRIFFGSGLGNMLFQVAAGLGLSRRHGVPVVFSGLNLNLLYLLVRRRQYGLVPALRYRKIFFSQIKTGKMPSGIPEVAYPHHFEDLPLPEKCSVVGFFQSQKYFYGMDNEIRKMYTPDAGVLRRLDKYQKYFQNKSVSLHVRRGDYLKNLPVMNEEYFRQGLERIGDFEHCLVMSDDLPWCRKTFAGFPNNKRFVFIEEPDYIALFMMSRCHHNIISNSTFSWWGAWLNSNPEKLVIAPKFWLPNVDEREILPPEWIRV